MGEGPGQLLLQRQEEAWRQGERGDPQTGDRLHRLVAAECDSGDLEEQVGAEPGDEQADPYRERSFR